MNLLRTVEAEWLDQLAADDPRAIRSRLDLRRINTCMLQAAIMARRLSHYLGQATPRTLIDLGSGDGAYCVAGVRGLELGNVAFQSAGPNSLVSRKIFVPETFRENCESG